MKALLVISVCVSSLALAQETAAPAKAPKAAAKTPRADAGAAKAASLDAGASSKVAATDAGAKDAAKSVADAGGAKDAVARDAGPRDAAVTDAGAKVEGKAGAKYTLVAVAAPDKKTERTWKAKCGSCHGENGKGATEKGKKMKVGDMTQAGWQTSHDDAELKDAILKGVKEEKDGVKKEMDAYQAELSAEQVDALLRYVRFVGAPK